MKIILIGSIKFSEACLEKLIEIDSKPVGVCTLEKSTFNSDHLDLTELCNKNNIPVSCSSDINSEKSIDWIKSFAPDVIFCFGWSRLLKSELLKISPLGVIGFHPAALPANRGRHPLTWALVLGLHETASTFFFMDQGADSGDILSQCQIKISENDDVGSLYKKVMEVAIKQLEKFVPVLASGNYKRLPQEHSKANSWRKRENKDGEIDWRASANSIHNLVRGLSKPYVGAHFLINEKQIKVWKTEVITNMKKNIEPGKVLKSIKGMPVIKTGDNAIKLVEIDPAITLYEGAYL
ncbi:formyltransferase family protein [Candidatus Thioglobus sp.]|nr:formyltransferase family protein [Candidatus Thioglobus sp.]